MGRNSRVSLKAAIPGIALLIGLSLSSAGAQRPAANAEAAEDFPRRTVSGDNCSYLQNPNRFIEDSELRYATRTSEINRVIRWTVSLDGSSTGLVHPNSIQRNNFIDDEIFTRMASDGIRSAQVSTDLEFLRRVTLDLTGRIPSPTDVTSFLSDISATRRDAVIEKLMVSPEFTDKWTMFLGDLFENTARSSQVIRNLKGKDAFYFYLKEAIDQNKPYDRMARELITATGDSYTVGPANWPVGNIISMGPIQDTYDGAAVDLGNMFMGISAVDCLLCHDGARHLDQINLWGASQTRLNFWGLSAYFSRTTMDRAGEETTTLVSDNSTGAYRLNTNYGNRVAREPMGGMDTIPPRYPFSTSGHPGSDIRQGETYRQALARQVTADLQFSRAAVNYVWEKLMVEAFVTPSNGFDLARLDPNNPPPAPWTLQPTNAQLLDRLARFFQSNGYNLRQLIRMIVKSNAYQLSSTYNGEWKASYVPYYARKYVRRLDAEEIADALAKATGFNPTYAIIDGRMIKWAMQLPDPFHPLNGSAEATFLNEFGRGDRDLNPRHSDASVSQALTLMNSPFVTARTRSASTVNRVYSLLQASSDPAYLIRQLYLHTLSRPATDEEVNALLPTFQQQGNAVAAEDLQWVLLNRVQFLFNY